MSKNRQKERVGSVKAFYCEADYAPRADRYFTNWEKETRKIIMASKAWKNPRAGLVDIPVPKPGPDEVLLKVKACGVCGSDIHVFEIDKEGYTLYPGMARFPVVLGHEISGEVVEVGPNVRNLKPGDMVAVEEMHWCGKCRQCSAGNMNHCEDIEEIGYSFNGGYAEYTVAGAKHCWKLDSLRDVYDGEQRIYEAGALVEPTGVAYNGMFINAGGFLPGSYVVVYGAGPVGLAATVLARAAGAALVITVEVSPDRRKVASEMGADIVLDPIQAGKESSLHEQLLEITRGQGVDFQVEAAGVPMILFPEIEKALAVNGKVVQIGRVPERVPVDIEMFMNRRGKIYGSLGHGAHSIFPNIIRLMASRRIDMTRVVTGRFPLSRTADAIEQARKKIDAKVMVEPELA